MSHFWESFPTAGVYTYPMGKRGRRPQPTSLKRLHGTFRADRVKGPEPLAPGLLLEAPPWLDERQAVRFAEILRDAPRHLLRKWDSAVVASYCVAESLLIEASEARKALESGGLLDLDAKGRVMVGNLVKVQLRAMAAMKPFMDMLGLAPSSRANLKLDDGAVEDEDPREAAKWAWFDLTAQRPQTEAEKKAQRKELDRLYAIMYPRPAPSRRKKDKAEAEGDAVPSATAQPP